MKKILFFAALAALTACGDTTPAEKPVEEGTFTGTVTVTTTETGDVFTQDNTRFRLSPQEDGSMTMQMLETSFAEGMPPLDMDVPGIDHVDGVLTAASTTPEIAGTPYARYIITDLTGTVKEKRFEVEFTCGGAYQIVYAGMLIEE